MVVNRLGLNMNAQEGVSQEQWIQQLSNCFGQPVRSSTVVYHPKRVHVKLTLVKIRKKKAVVQQTYRFKHAVDGRVTGYTVNLYSTNNRLLINGKDIDTLMDRHLPVLHEVMCQGLRDDNIESVEKYNSILAEQMSIIWRQRRGETVESSPQMDAPTNTRSPAERTSDDGVRMNLSNLLNSPCTDVKQLYECKDNNPRSQPEKSSISPEHDKCSKCKKNVRTNAAVCQIGKHWIHYRCDKLTESEINRLHNDQGFIYNCKNCSSHETIRKTVAANTNTTIILQIPECNPTEGTASEILKEETLSMCPICDTCINEAESVCSTCTSIFHSKCMSETNEEMCLACASTEMQIAEANTSMKVNTLHSPGPRENLSNINTQKPEHSIQSNQKEQQTLSLNPVRSKKDSSISQTNSLKQRELRQTELRLRKWEDELKVREAKCTESYQGVSRLEEYVRKVEARNQELQETIRTLKRKIDIQDSYTTNSSSNDTTENLYRDHNTSRKTDPLYESNSLILGVQNQVTNFIMRKVAKQIHNLEQMDEGEQTNEGNISGREKGSWPRPPNNEGMQQQLYTEPEVTIKSVNGNNEHQAATYAKSQAANPMSNKPALPPHLLKTVPPPPYLQGQPLVANYTPYCYPPLSQITSQPPAVPPRTNPNMVVGMAAANTSDIRQPFLRQTMPQKRRM